MKHLLFTLVKVEHIKMQIVAKADLLDALLGDYCVGYGLCGPMFSAYVLNHTKMYLHRHRGLVVSVSDY
jgi:hypothetical protein